MEDDMTKNQGDGGLRSNTSLSRSEKSNPTHETRREFGKSAAFAIAAMGLAGAQCGNGPSKSGPGACADPVGQRPQLVVKVFQDNDDTFYELVDGTARVCKNDGAGAAPIQMTLSADSVPERIFVTPREGSTPMADVFQNPPDAAGFPLEKNQPRTFVVRPTIGVQKRPDGSRCGFCDEEKEFAKLVLFDYRLTEGGPTLGHQDSALDTDFHLEC